MIAYIIQAALASGVFDAIHVSTDSVEVAELVAEFGIEVDFLSENDRL
jgi:CMP-N-acetylneuraminic acid synthetase